MTYRTENTTTPFSSAQDSDSKPSEVESCANSARDRLATEKYFFEKNSGRY
jgi:hypothetical protein